MITTSYEDRGCLREAGAGGSNPLTPTNLINKLLNNHGAIEVTSNATSNVLHYFSETPYINEYSLAILVAITQVVWGKPAY